MHRVGATALSALLEFDPPNSERRQLPCPCGHTARYLELRSKTVLTAVGPARILRPYYLCEQCHCGQFPVDVELDVENTELSPGVRRMLAAVGHEAAFDEGRQQMELLAGLSVTTKAVERTAEAIGEDIEVRQQRELERALQLELPIPLGPRIPILYVEMDGTGIPVVKKETKGRAGKQDGQPAHTREAKLGCIFTQTTVDEQGYPVRDEASTSYVGAIEGCEPFGRRLYAEAWQRGQARADKTVVLAGRRSRMDLESGRSPLPGGHPDRRSLSCPPAPVGFSSQTPTQRFPRTETLGDGGERQTGQREDRRFGRLAALADRFSSRCGRGH